VDKLLNPHGAWIKKNIIATLLLFIAFSGGALAQQAVWSFSDNPHPTRSEMTAKEIQTIEDAYKSGDLNIMCPNAIDVAYGIYQDRYPDFLNAGDKEKNLLNWKAHVISAQRTALSVCVFYTAMLKFSPLPELPEQSDFYFCGVYSRLPQNDLELDYADAIDELLTLVEAEAISGAISMLGAKDVTKTIVLNPDIKYYFSSLLLPRMDANETISKLVDFSGDLTQERREFVELAAKNFDLQAVLDTTKPCSGVAKN